MKGPAPTSHSTTQGAVATVSKLALEDKRVVIIGGGSGLGYQVASQCVAKGAKVTIAGRGLERLEAAREALGPEVSIQAVDVMDEGSLQSLFAAQDRVDCLFNTAGVYVSGPMRDLSVQQAMTAFDAKFWGQYRAVKAAIPKLTPDASVVLIAGADAVRPTAATPAYVACNAGLEGLGRGLAFELAPIRVNVISPGYMDGNFWSTRKNEAERAEAYPRYRDGSTLGRVGTEAEVAHGVVFLFENTFLTGSVVRTDGGYSLQ